MKQILLFLLLTASSWVFAETSTQDKLNRLEAELNDVRQEQQAVYQNYQMTRDLRRLEVQEGSPPTSQYPYGKSIYGTDINTPPPNYDDVVRTQMEREQRIQHYTNELKGLSARYLELEDRRRALLELIKKLKQQQGS
ncbi:hypothetical protein FGKAn22_22620 [Ferrigenium kumadai]|uniref:Uncharacterized protein n=1 Tax=Ferrigenium kumadai TaxID=1682490 RepID=A0AAN1T2E4_9PROT|nr:hypothetical protein [Ferrigenium kumadai]BBJ00570.1 hypothetical protein FGKAn22_22620 [Ferrigenium kumadai]